MINYHTSDQEGDIDSQKQLNISPISRRYSGLNNPRIVRVSRAFGGKDRHSKVLTVKGLRDRRIRLSVPTAVELYHLQDQLGLNQPSKVIDWLLDATKDDIHKLPPLQMTPQDFNRFHIPPKFEPRDFNATQLALSPFFNHPSNGYDHNHHQRTSKGKQAVVEQHKYYCCNHDSCDHLHEPSYSNLSLAANYSASDPQLLFSGSYGSMTPSFFAPYLVSNHFQFLSSSNSPAALNFSESTTQEKVPFGLDMNSKVKFS